MWDLLFLLTSKVICSVSLLDRVFAHLDESSRQEDDE